jgi:hypothetical protein
VTVVGSWEVVDTRVILAGLWVAVMLTYLLGDVLRIFAGDIEPGKLAGGMRATPLMWLVIAALMLIPILMLVLSLTVDYPAIRWLNIIAAAFLIVFNIVGLPYRGAYDNFLIVVSLAFNAVIVWYAWNRAA